MRRLACLFVALLIFIPVFALADTDASVLASINQYRASQHLRLIQEDPYTCTVAAIRAVQIMNDYSHAGFYPLVRSSWVPQGMWHENLADKWGSDFSILLAWQRSSLHNANLLAPLQAGCVRHVGNYWVFEGFHE